MGIKQFLKDIREVRREARRQFEAESDALYKAFKKEARARKRKINEENNL